MPTISNTTGIGLGAVAPRELYIGERKGGGGGAVNIRTILLPLVGEWCGTCRVYIEGYVCACSGIHIGRMAGD